MNVLIVSSSDGITLSLLRCLGLIGARSHVINVWNAANSSRLSRFCGHYLNYPLSKPVPDTAALTAFINDYCDRHSIEVVIPCGLLGTFLIAKTKSEITSAPVFPVTSAEQLYNLHNKWLFYQFLRKHEIPTPETRLIETSEQLGSLNLEFPVIVKPVAEGNSNGVKKIDSATELKQYAAISAQKNKLPILIQDYIVGADWSLNVLADQGKILAWTIHRRTTYLFEFFRSDEILEIAQKIVFFSNYSGVANFDLRFDEQSNSVQVIECNPRFWACFAASVYYGVDFVKLGILAAQNKGFPDDLRREVTNVELSPNPTPNKFIGGLIRGKYFGLSTKNFTTDLAWQGVLDPLPHLYEKAWNRLGITVGHDGEMLKELL